jgi:hypothetical protein
MNRILKTPEQVQQEQAAAQAQQVQMMIFEKMLDTEAAALIAQSKPVASGGGKSGGKSSGSGQGSGGGRPATMQFEGKIPGAGLSSAIRGMAQDMGANALGLEGMGDSGGEG